MGSDRRRNQNRVVRGASPLNHLAAHREAQVCAATAGQRHSDLIYDVGLFDGGDTGYYLFRGYRVIAIDANPMMIECAAARFAKEVREGRLTLLNVGVADKPGTLTFWISDCPEWSSFDRTIASREDTAHRPVPVPVVPFAQLLAAYGTPHYLKIDIEGNDRLCVDALRGMALPKYISVESECVGDSTVLSDQEAMAVLNSLRDVGYKRFKLIKQNTWISRWCAESGRKYRHAYFR